MSLYSRTRARAQRSGRALALTAVAGLALSVAGSASGVSLIRLLIQEAILDTGNGGSGQLGATVVVGNLDFAHVWPTHEAFGGREIRVWWPADDDPSVTDVGMARGAFFSAHATAAASAMAGNWPKIPNAPIGTFPDSVIGFAPDAPIILSGGFGAGVNPFGLVTGVTNTSIGFAIFALTDPMVAGFASTLLGIPPYPVATVLNASFGDTQKIDRLGEDLVAHAMDATVFRNDTVVVAAAGDDGNNDVLLALVNMMGDPKGTVSSPATAYNVLSVGRLNDQLAGADQDTSNGPVGAIDWRSAGSTMLSSILPQTFSSCMPAPAALVDQIPATRTAVDVGAPGTTLVLAGSPALDPPTLDPVAADTAVSTLWTGTSFSSAIVAGLAAIVQDFGNKRDLWPKDTAGNVALRGLATRAILINSADDEKAQSQIQTMSSSDPAEMNACIFQSPLGPRIGSGIVSPERILNQVRGTQVADVRAGHPYIVDGIDRQMVGFTRGDYAPTTIDPTDMFRADPPLPGSVLGQSLDFIVGNMLTPPTQDWFGPWMSGAVPAIGTEVGIPFVTFVQRPQDPAMAPGPAPVTAPPGGNDGRGDLGRPRAIDSGPAVDDPSHMKDLGQPGFGDFDVNLDHDRFSLSPGGNFVIPGAFPSAGGATSPTGGGGGGMMIRTGWDVGRMGVGFIDYPLGTLTPDSNIRATLVWNRTEEWSQSFLSSWATTIGFNPLISLKADVRASDEESTLGGSYPAPRQTSNDFLLPAPQDAFALENFDLELWRENTGTSGGSGNVLVASSRQMWSTVEHLSVGPDAVCDPQGQILFGRYFIRVLFKDTVFDLGGYRFCADVQSMQINRPGSTIPYKNVYPGEADFGVAWYVDLANSPEGGILGASMAPPRDMDGNGRIDAVDQSLMIQARHGDYNTDGVIDAADIASLISEFGGDDPLYDMNGDGAIDGTDLAHLLAKFGQTP